MFNCFNIIKNKNECPCKRIECQSYWNLLLKQKSNKHFNLHHCDFINYKNGEICHRITTDSNIYKCAYCKQIYCINHVSIQLFKEFKKPHYFCDRCIVENDFINV